MNGQPVRSRQLPKGFIQYCIYPFVDSTRPETWLRWATTFCERQSVSFASTTTPSHTRLHAPKRHHGFISATNSSKKRGQILMDYPGLVEDICDMDKNVKMVVHPVRPIWSTWSKGAIQVCTMRRIRRRLQSAHVLSLSNVRVAH